MANSLIRCTLILFLATMWGCAVVPVSTLEGSSEPSESSTEPAPTVSDAPSQGQEQHRSTEEAPPSGQLTAGVWRDLDHWDFWTALFDQQSQHSDNWGWFESHWEYYTRNHFSVVVRSQGEPAVDVLVELLNGDQEVIWRTRTDNRGRAELFNGLFGEPGEGPLSVVATAGESSAVLSPLEQGPQARRHLDLDAAPDPVNALDLMFVIDTTGSMGDELSYLQSELQDTIERVSDSADTLRLSVNFYRDHGDEYLVRSFPFTENVDAVIQQLAAQRAAGGGDIPEAVDRAMDDAIYNHVWSEEATARLLFLVLDAPPNYNEPDMARLEKAITGAAERGVRIIPVVGSGTDVSTEFLMRSFAIVTGGTYVFITDHSGIGESHLEPTIGSYEVEMLNNLLVRLITEALE